MRQNRNHFFQGLIDKQDLQQQNMPISNDTVIISDDNLIGEGAHAKVYRHEHAQNIFAIKVFHEDENARIAYKTECNLSQVLSHPNVSSAFGYISELNFSLIMDYAPHGSLENYLEKKGPINWQVNGFTFAAQIAGAMNYLHQLNIIHADIKTANVLVFSEDLTKLSDFSFSIYVNDLIHNNPRRGTIAWMAPEVFNDLLSFQSDTYSFGMLLWSMMTGDKPWDGLSNFEIVSNVSRGIRPTIPNAVNEPSLNQLIEHCWHNMPSKRVNDKVLMDSIRELKII